MSNYARERNG